MKKVRDIPPEHKEVTTWSQTIEYLTYLKNRIAEEGQVSLAMSFTEGKEDNGLPLSELDYTVLKSCLKPIPNDLDEKPTIWEEGEEVCYSYGILTLRGLLRWALVSGKKYNWLMAIVTEKGQLAITHSQKENGHG